MRVGINVTCAKCRRMKNPIGRSGPMTASYCDHECEGYREPPYVGSLWPGESEADFGYPIGNDGTIEVADAEPPGKEKG